MSSEVNVLFVTLEQLRKTLEETWDKTGIAVSQSADLGGEFEQEISTDLDGIQGAIRQITDDLDSVMEEAKTLWEDFDDIEESMRAGLGNEENYKTDAEHIQDEMREDKG